MRLKQELKVDPDGKAKQSLWREQFGLNEKEIDFLMRNVVSR